MTLCTAFSVCPWSLPSGHPLSDGPSRLWPCQSEESGKQASYGVPGQRRGVGVGSGVLGQAFPIGETARRRLVPEANASVGEVGRRNLMSGHLFFWVDLSVGDRTCPFGPLCFRLLGQPMNYVLFFWAEPWRGSRSLRDPGFVNPTPVKQFFLLQLYKQLQ